ncbi:MAG: phosphate ABC transporter permease PstA [Bacilli bacterium]|nr:phosphate ABC transporter permease PstA [Bacilli bacterium]
MNIRKLKEVSINLITYLFSSIGLIVLAVLLIFIFSNGYKLISFDLVTDDYFDELTNLKLDERENYILGNYQNPNIENAYFSSKWGIALKDAVDNENKPIVLISYLDEKSPLNNMIDVQTDEYKSLEVGNAINKIILSSEEVNYIMGLSKDKAENLILKFEQGDVIKDMITLSLGGGIRGSLLTTLYLIVLTLLFALPLGIGTAIYLTEFAKQNKFTDIIKNAIDLIAGMPSIIFGLMGATVFIPFTSKLLNSNGGNLLSGALTLAVILLPTIAKTTEEALKAIPNKYRNASFALGASKTQTTFRVIIPNALSGILTATLLSIGRIIGESAALIYAIGTAIKDDVSISNKSTTLAVHIWSMMSGENPNFELSCAISIIILIIVFILSMSVKFISKKINRFQEVN